MSFGFFLRDEEFVSKTINDSNIDLNKFPASKVHQLAKKMESSKATGKHIKQFASDPQATQIHLMRHQWTELLPSKFQRKQEKHFKPSKDTNKQYSHEDNHKQYYKEDIIVIKHMKSRKDVRNVVTQGILRDLDVQWANINARIAINLVISVACATRRLDMRTKGPWSQDHTRHIDWSLAQFVHKITYVASQKISV